MACKLKYRLLASVQTVHTKAMLGAGRCNLWFGRVHERAVAERPKLVPFSVSMRLAQLSVLLLQVTLGSIQRDLFLHLLRQDLLKLKTALLRTHQMPEEIRAERFRSVLRADRTERLDRLDRGRERAHEFADSGQVHTPGGTTP